VRNFALSFFDNYFMGLGVKIPLQLFNLLVSALVISSLAACGMGSGPLGSSPVGSVNQATDSSNGASGEQVALNEPMGAGSADPIASVDKTVHLIFGEVSVICVYSQEQWIKFQAAGKLKTQDGVSRVLRVVDVEDKEFFDIQSDPNTGEVSFVAVTGFDKDIKIYVMPKNFVPGPLNTPQACQNGVCAPGGKKPVLWGWDLPYNPANSDAPECMQMRKVDDLDIHKIITSPTGSSLQPGAGKIHIGD
jgi:hypothetical protein